MDSRAASSELVESTAPKRKMSRRRRPLRACGVSIFAIACKAYTKAQESNGPVGSMTKRMTKLAALTFPFMHALQYQWLAVLSFVDDHILALEKIIETLFPPSTRLFNKIDEFVHSAETLPGKFDDAVKKVPSIIQQVPFLDWALICMISWLKFLISNLTHWGSNNSREEEIMVDKNCDDIESPSQVQTVVSDFMKCSYKEMLEKGTKESTEKKEDGFMEDDPEAEEGKKDENKSNETIGKDDPILELFEASWNMKPGK